MSNLDHDDEIVPIRLDRETCIRLARLAHAVGDHPVAVAASLLRDLLLDDEIANVEAMMAPRTLHS